MFPLRSPNLRSRQAGCSMGAGGRGRAAGADLPDVRAGAPGLGRRARSLLRMRRNTPVGDPGRGGVPGMRSHGTLGRLAQLAERRPYKAKVGGSRPSAPTERTSCSKGISIRLPNQGTGLRSRAQLEPHRSRHAHQEVRRIRMSTGGSLRSSTPWAIRLPESQWGESPVASERGLAKARRLSSEGCHGSNVAQAEAPVDERQAAEHRVLLLGQLRVG